MAVRHTRRGSDGAAPSGALAALGVVGDEERLYRALLRSGPVTISALAAAVGIPATRVRRLVPRLLVLGLATQADGRPLRLLPSPPDAAVEALAARRIEEVNRSRAVTPLLVEEALRGATARPEELLELVTGRDAVARRYLRLFDAAREEVRTLVRPPYTMEPLDPDHPQTSAGTRPGVRIRSIYDPSALTSPAELAFLRTCVDHGEHARINEVPVKLFLVDRRVAMLPLTSGGVVESSLVVHPSTLLDALLLLFDTLWRTAVPLPPGEPTDDAAAREATVVALLMAGLTDEAIGRQLGVSSRTVQRDVRKICDDLGAVTRFQAGLKLGRTAGLDVALS